MSHSGFFFSFDTQLASAREFIEGYHLFFDLWIFENSTREVHVEMGIAISIRSSSDSNHATRRFAGRGWKGTYPAKTQNNQYLDPLKGYFEPLVNTMAGRHTGSARHGPIQGT